MTGRSLPEWIGKTPDSKVPDHVRARIFLNADGMCHISGRKIGPADLWDLEHVIPLSMGGEHRESNLRPALRDKHREKTAAEAGPRAKADRIRKKHLGITAPKRKLQGPGFRKSQPQRTASSPIQRKADRS